MKKLPIYIAGITEIITEQYVYIDETRHIYNFINNWTYYFLFRLRRFCELLLIDTLKQAFSGQRKLFNGLFLEHNWNWDTSYPVLGLRPYFYRGGFVLRMSWVLRSIVSWMIITNNIKLMVLSLF